ncbi:MAG: hypothetical protein GX605_12215 [Chloroflexi bacterium]|nr:hypothetical protein [Chloroflexota bacterium]
MKIGAIEAQPGQKAFGFLEGPQTRGGFVPRLPLHLVVGRQDGPVLLVQAGVSGLEIEPAMTLPGLVQALDPATLRGALLCSPLLNTSGFEFDRERTAWDDADLHALGRGPPDGSPSEALLHRYFHQAVARADAVLEIRTGALWGYFRYAGVYQTGALAASQALALALGLPQVLLGQPPDRSLAWEAASEGKAVVSAWIGGGPGLRDHRHDDAARVRRAVGNALRHLGMLPDRPELEGPPPSVLQAHTVLRVGEPRGLTFMESRWRGQRVAAGQRLGTVLHPFSGETLQEIVAPREGVMLHAGASWPVLPEGALLAILGDLVENAPA